MGKPFLDLKEILLQKIIWLDKLPAIIVGIVLLLPQLLLITVAIYTLRAYFYLGTLPKPYTPDPTDLPFDLHYDVGFYLLKATVWSMTLYPGLLFQKFRRLILASKWTATAFLFSWVGLLVALFVPPIDFLSWFMD